MPNGSHVEQLQNAHVELVCQLRLLNGRTILSHEIKSLGNYEVGIDEALKQVLQKSHFLVRMNANDVSLDFEKSQIFNELFSVFDLVNASLV